MHARSSKITPVPLTLETDSLRPKESKRMPLPFSLNGRLPMLAQIVFIISALVAFAYVARSVVLPVMVAWVVSMALKPPVRWLHACRLPTPLAAALVVALVTLVLAAGVVHLSRPAVEWLQSAPENVPRLKEKFHHLFRPVTRLNEAVATMGNLDASDGTNRKPQPVEVKDNSTTTTVFTWTGSVLAGIGETVALVFLLLATGDSFVQKLVQMMPTLRDKRQTLEISREIQQHISGYLFSVGLVNIGFGITVGLVFHWLGMPNALMWGSAAALLNFVPYFGPVAGVIVVALAGLFAFDTLGKAVLPAGAYLILHLVEANAVTPFVLGRRFTLNPVVIFVTLIFCIWLWGVTGALLAVPLLVTLKVICDRVSVLATVGEFLSSQNPLSKDL